MTANRSFKRRVRDRMARTGESYTTARAHLLDDHTRVTGIEGLLPGWRRTGGLQPDLAATANALAHAGATRHDGRALDEIDVLGLSGGIGFMYAVFEWQGHAPTLTLTTRTDAMPDPTVAQALARSGVRHEVFETTGPTTARRHLSDALQAERPALVSVDDSRLPHRQPDAPPEGGLPRVVGLIGHRDGVVLLDDEDPDPIEITDGQLAAARNALPRSRHRLVVLASADAPHDHRTALRAALRRTVDDYDTPPARPFASNVGTAGLRKWAQLLTTAGARSWPKVFDRPEWRARAYDRTRACIDEDLTAPGAGRGLWARFVDRAAAALDEPALLEVAEAARASEQAWVELATTARAADPDEDPGPVFARMAELVTDVADRERALLAQLDGVLAD